MKKKLIEEATLGSNPIANNLNDIEERLNS